MKKTMLRAGAFACALGAVIQMAACGDDDDTPATPIHDAGAIDGNAPVQDVTQPPHDAGQETVSIRFAAKVGTETFRCGTQYSNLGTTADTIEPHDLRFFVQDVALIDATGKEVPVTLEARAPWQTTQVALLDFEDGSGQCSNGNADMNAVVTGSVPAGSYTGLAFTNGVPAADNHADPATAQAPLTAGGMTWGWLFGHLFIKAEVGSTTTDGGYGLLHLGSVGCSNATDGGDDNQGAGPSVACSQGNRNRITLSTFDVSKNTVVLDVKTLFASTDLKAESKCHSMGPACPPLFSNVGLDFDGGARMPAAPAFRVE